MVEGLADEVAVALAVSARDNDLCARAKSKSQHEQHKIKHASQGRSAKLNIAHTTQKSGVGDIDQVLRHAAQNDGVGDAPDTFI